MGAILAISQYRLGHYWIDMKGALFLSMTRQHPEWRDDRDAQLHGSLILYTRLICKVRWAPPSIRFSCSWYSSRCRAHEMSGVNFDSFTPFGTHLLQSVLCFLR